MICQAASASSSLRHREEIQFNRLVWTRKRCLRRAYRSFQQRIAGKLTSIPGALVVELGSGIGSLKEVIPECVTTDIFPNEWLDRQENAYALSFADRSVSNLILFDVWHHLEYPGAALQEFSRVLVEGGRVILFEPAMSILGKFVYGFLHNEPLGSREPVHWNAPKDFDPTRARYFAAQSQAARIFQQREITAWTSEWKLLSIEGIVSFAYLLSGGFSRPQLNPDGFLPAIMWLDRLLARFPTLFAARLLIVLERKPSDG